MRVAYELKEDFREIYEKSKSLNFGQNALKKWLKLALLFYREATQTVRRHFELTCNYFISRTTSGVMEGINNRIKLIMRQGYGNTQSLKTFSHAY